MIPQKTDNSRCEAGIRPPRFSKTMKKRIVAIICLLLCFVFCSTAFADGFSPVLHSDGDGDGDGIELPFSPPGDGPTPTPTMTAAPASTATPKATEEPAATAEPVTTDEPAAGPVVTEGPGEKPTEAPANTGNGAPKKNDPVPAGETAAAANATDPGAPAETGSAGWILWIILALLLGGGLYLMIKRKKKTE